MPFDMRVVPIVIVATVIGTLVLVAIVYMIYRTQLAKKQQRTRAGLSEKAPHGDTTPKFRSNRRRTTTLSSSPKRISLLTSLPTRPTRRFQHESSPLRGPVSSHPPDAAKPRSLRRKSSISNLEEGLISMTEKNHKMLDKIDRDFVSSPVSVHLSSGRARDGGAQHQFMELDTKRHLSGAHEKAQTIAPARRSSTMKNRASLQLPAAAVGQKDKSGRMLARKSVPVQPARPMDVARSATYPSRDERGTFQRSQATEGSTKPSTPRNPVAMVLQPPSHPRRATIDMDTIKAASISAMTSLFFDPKAPEPGRAREPSSKPEQSPRLSEKPSRRSSQTSAGAVIAPTDIRKDTQTLQPFSPGQRLTSMPEETSPSEDSPNSAAPNSSESSKRRTRLPLHIHTKRLSARGETSFLESASTSDPGVLDASHKDPRRSRHSINSSTLLPTYTVGGVTRIPIIPAPRPRSMHPRISRYPPPPPPKDPTDGGKPLPSPPASVPPSIISDWRTDDSRSYNVSPLSSRFPENGAEQRQDDVH